MNLETAKRIVSCGECWTAWRPLVPFILLGLMALLLPIGLGLFLSDAARSAGSAMIIIGGVASTMLLITCCWACCSAAHEEARKTVATQKPTLTIRTPRTKEDSLDNMV